MFWKPIFLLMVPLLIGGCSTGGLGLETKYKPSGLTGGYSEKEVEPGIYRVKAVTNGMRAPDFTRAMALYRAAELTEELGKQHFQIIDFKGKTSTIRQGGTYRGQGPSTIQLWIRPVDDPEERLDCRAERPANCQKFSVKLAKALSGDKIGQPGGMKSMIEEIKAKTDAKNEQDAESGNEEKAKPNAPSDDGEDTDDGASELQWELH